MRQTGKSAQDKNNPQHKHVFIFIYLLRGSVPIVYLDAGIETRYNRPMELVQLKNLFAELKKKSSDLRGFL